MLAAKLAANRVRIPTKTVLGEATSSPQLLRALNMHYERKPGRRADSAFVLWGPPWLGAVTAVKLPLRRTVAIKTLLHIAYSPSLWRPILRAKARGPRPLRSLLTALVHEASLQ